MGEYVKYKNTQVKLGTCEDIDYCSYQKFISALEAGHLKQMGTNSTPAEFVKPDSGYRFRFPFPDEDKLELGNYDDYYRGVPIKVERAVFSDDENGKQSTELFEMHIKQQKLIHREIDGKLCLALIWYDPVKAGLRRVENDAEMKNILKSIVRHHVTGENDPQKRNFYRQIAARILKGYKMDDTKLSVKQQAGQKQNAVSIKKKQGSRKRL